MLDATRSHDAAIRADTAAALDRFRKHQDAADRAAVLRQARADADALDSDAVPAPELWTSPVPPAEAAGGGRAHARARKRRKDRDDGRPLLAGVKIRKTSGAAAATAACGPSEDGGSDGVQGGKPANDDAVGPKTPKTADDDSAQRAARGPAKSTAASVEHDAGQRPSLSVPAPPPPQPKPSVSLGLAGYSSDSD